MLLHYSSVVKTALIIWKHILSISISVSHLVPKIQSDHKTLTMKSDVLLIYFMFFLFQIGFHRTLFEME